MNKAEAILTIARESHGKTVTKAGYDRCRKALKFLECSKDEMRSILIWLDFRKFVEADKKLGGTNES